MIDFSTLQGLTIPEGVVTQIADESGRVLWMLVGEFTIRIRDGDSGMLHINLTVNRGMTWSDFANSGMPHSEKVIIEDGTVYLYVNGLFTTKALIYLDGVPVLPTDKIYPDGAYAYSGSYG